MHDITVKTTLKGALVLDTKFNDKLVSLASQIHTA